MPKKTVQKNKITELSEQIYCSLDIETSDFDPSVGEILEVGMLFFKLEKNKIKPLREWTQTFKPAKEVPQKILALTGINMDELEDSPSFADISPEIQQMLNNTVVVGHNITFDIRFMEAFGIKFSGNKLDTLDLAQIFLPTNTSYNLEALMNFFDIHYKDAHRALSDARATLLVLEKILGRFAAFPQELQTQLRELFVRGDQQISILLQTQFKAVQLANNEKRGEISQSQEITEALKNSQQIITFPLGLSYYSYILGALSKIREKSLLVVPNQRILYRLWQDKIAAPIIDQKDLFDADRFERALQKKQSKENTNFLAKILIWQKINWQSKALIDLNLSFFGNQFKPLINFDSDKKVLMTDLKDKIAVTDYATFINNDFINLAQRKVIILDINNFESALTYLGSKKVSWSDFIYTLKQYYDPVSSIGRSELKEVVQSILADVDLFFGLASLNWQKLQDDSPNVLIEKKTEDTNEYMTVQKAAEGFVIKARKANIKLKSDKIESYLDCLESFFGESEGQIRWIELGDNRLAFFISPLNLEKISAEKIGPFKKLTFTASLGSEALVNYFAKRMCIPDFKIKTIGQQELRKKFIVKVDSSLNTPEKIVELATSLDYPSAILMPNMSAVRQFYEQNFKVLQDKTRIFAQGYSGGTNKLLENFQISPRSLLVATDRFVLKQIGRQLKVKNLVITRLPFEQFNHPLLAVQAQQYENKFEEFSIPRALYNFHTLIAFFYSDELEKIYILDQKIKKEYGHYFYDYLKSLPFVVIE